MPKLLRLRQLTAEEDQEIDRLVRSRTAAGAPGRAGPHHRPGAARGGALPAIAAARGGVASRRCATVAEALQRPGDRGAGGCPASGRPATYPPEQVGEVIAASLTDPQDAGPALRQLDAGPAGGVPDRGEGHPDEAQPDRGDPAAPRGCAGGSRRPGSASGSTRPSPQKGGHRHGSTPRPRRTASWSAWTRWGRRAPRASPASGWCASEPDRRTRRPRARQEIDYGRRGQGYVFGAFLPATGEALTVPYARPHHRQLGRLPGAGRGVARPRRRSASTPSWTT